MKLLLFFLCFFASISMAQKPYQGSISFQKFALESPNEIADFAIKANLASILDQNNLHYKYSNNGWHFIRTTPSNLSDLMMSGIVTQLFYTASYPKVLNDSSRVYQKVDSIHNGQSPLISSFKGEGVIMGYIDSGIDPTHGDFLNQDGTSRIIRYWDQAKPIHSTRTPEKYGYGQIWNNIEIDNGDYSPTGNLSHGTTVAGAGSGNGRAAHKYIGMAPESQIIMIETSFSFSNWTLTVADAIDYIFAVADSLGLPAVINTSVGDYLGSHDGTDPASMIIDSLIKAKSGRIVVAAAGNSGNWDHYHLKGDVTPDTTFTWFEVNPNSLFGTPAVFFDMWTDTADFNNVEFAFAADSQIPNNGILGRTEFFTIQSLLGLTTEDSIMVNNQKASPVSFFCEEVNGLYHIEAILENPDSTDYLYQFMTTGVGKYDLWSGFSIGLSKIKNDNLPNIVDYPNIIHYQIPDSLTSTVSSWTCLPSVVTVGNLANQLDYIDQNGDLYTFNHTPGKLSINSSKGPSRIGIQKPDVSATGDGTLSACPQHLITTLTNNGGNALALEGKHVRNGGTSMASPVIAGIAALYLEKCGNSTYLDFKNDLLNSTFEDGFTGTTPNYAYGYGKVNAFKTLNQTNYYPSIYGDTLICGDTAFVQTINNYIGYEWSNGDSTQIINLEDGDTLSVITTNLKGCKANSDSLIVIKGQIPIEPFINLIGGGFTTTPAYEYQWYLDNLEIPNATEQFFNPSLSGDYSIKVTGKEGCYLLADTLNIDIDNIKELENNEFIIFPNPFNENIRIIKNDFYDVEIEFFDVSGRVVHKLNHFESEDLFINISLSNLPSGIYFVRLNYNKSYKIIKLVKQ